MKDLSTGRSVEKSVNKSSQIVGEEGQLQTGDSEVDIELARLAAERAADTGETPNWKFLEGEDTPQQKAA